MASSVSNFKNDCPVCLEEIALARVQPSSISSLVSTSPSCNLASICARMHLAHQECIKRWDKSCPFCRESLIVTPYDFSIPVTLEMVTQTGVSKTYEVYVNEKTTFLDLLKIPEIFEKVVGRSVPSQEIDARKDVSILTPCYRTWAFIQPVISREHSLQETKATVHEVKATYDCQGTQASGSGVSDTKKAFGRCNLNDRVALGKGPVHVRLSYIDLSESEQVKPNFTTATKEVPHAEEREPCTDYDTVYERERELMSATARSRDKRVAEQEEFPAKRPKVSEETMLECLDRLMKEALKPKSWEETQKRAKESLGRRCHRDIPLIAALNAVIQNNNSVLARNAHARNSYRTITGCRLPETLPNLPITNDITMEWIQNFNQLIEKENRNIAQRNECINLLSDVLKTDPNPKKESVPKDMREVFLQTITLPPRDEDETYVTACLESGLRLGFIGRP